MGPARASTIRPSPFVLTSDTASQLVWSRPPILDSVLRGEEEGWDTAAQAAEALAEWSMWTDRALPPIDRARADFRETMVRETDLSPGQIATVLDRVAPPPDGDSSNGGAPAPEEWVERCGVRFLRRTRGWFPVWLGYVSWIFDWCKSRDYSTIVFLCRDSLPFFALARELAAGDPDAPDLGLVHVTRRTMSDPGIAHHISDALGDAESIAFVDTGCYGSVVPQLIDPCRRHDRPPAVFFYFSRSPLIFGYMNYLMSFEMLNESSSAATATAPPADFTIYAGDVVEAQPKPYHILSLSDHGIPDVEVNDPLSFVLSSELLGELTAFAASQRMSPRNLQQRAREAMLDRHRSFALVEDRGARTANQLFDDPAPKKPTTTSAAETFPLEGLPPQGEFFGLSAG